MLPLLAFQPPPKKKPDDDDDDVVDDVDWPLLKGDDESLRDGTSMFSLLALLRKRSRFAAADDADAIDGLA